MVEYSKTAADNKQRIREMTWMKGRRFITMAACVLLLSVFFLCVGIFGKSSEALQMGIYTGTLTVVLLVMYAILYDKYQKAVTKNFYSYEVDGKIDFTLEKLDAETLEFTRMTDEEVFRIQKSDIKTVRHLKTIHVIILKDGRTIDLPKQDDVDELLNNF